MGPTGREELPTILLIRHAQASYGAADYDVLSDIGHRQAARLDAALAHRGVQPVVVVSGPALRHRDTARLCRQTLGAAAASVDVRWGEYDTDGVLARHGRTRARLEGPAAGQAIPSRDFQVILDAALDAWLRDEDHSVPSAWPNYCQCVSSALDELGASLERGQTALVFTSAGTISAACCAVLELPAASFVALNRVQVNTGITKVIRGSRGSSLISFNEHGHLEEADRFLVTYR